LPEPMAAQPADFRFEIGLDMQRLRERSDRILPTEMENRAVN